MPGRQEGVLRAAQWLLTVVVCALAAHAAVYRSIVPGEGLHRIVGRYQAAALGLSLLALLALWLLAAGRWRLLPGRARRGFASAVTCLAPTAVAALLIQESVEHLLAAGSPGLPAWGVGTWVVATGTVLLATLALAAAERTCLRLAATAVPCRPSPSPRRRVRRLPGGSSLGGRRRNVLAERAGLRAPPLAVA